MVDMAVLHVLAVWLGWHLTFSKVCSAETALLNNFLWNELWTFAEAAKGPGKHSGGLGRLWRFHVICGSGIGLAVLFLHLFHTWLGLNLYLANLLAIGMVTLWNFWLNALRNWHVGSTSP